MSSFKYPKVKAVIPKAKVKFGGELLIIGCGGVSQCTVPLVLRHFGGREQLLREIIAGGARALAAMAEPETDDLPPLTVLHEIHRYVLEEGRMTALLVPRAEVDGLAPAVLLAGVQLPLGALASWLGDQASGESGPDPRAVAMVLGAAVFGLAAVQPFLTSSVGFHEEDPSEVMRQCVDVLTGLTGAALQAGQDPGGVQEA